MSDVSDVSDMVDTEALEMVEEGHEIQGVLDFERGAGSFAEWKNTELGEKFLAWVHTAGGRHIANRIIRRCWGYWRRGRRMGIKAIWETERWRFGELKKRAASRGNRLGKAEGYAFNNSFTAYMARFVMEKEERLDGFFELREVNRAPRTGKDVSRGLHAHLRKVENLVLERRAG